MKDVILQGNALDVLKGLSDNSVDCVVTSPPYWGLRDYGHEEQLGMEKTPEKFVSNLADIFDEIKRVLKDTGTIWVNLGDSYWGGKGQSGQKDATVQEERNSLGKSLNVGAQQMGGKGITMPKDGKHPEIKPKDLVGIPWMVAFELRKRGWYLRQDIIWNKPNPMPESVTDRCTKAHEYIFLLSKSPKYYYDHEAIKTDMQASSLSRLSQDVELQEGSDRVPGKTNGKMKAVRANGIVRDRLLDYSSKEKQLRPNSNRGGYDKEQDLPTPSDKANKRSVWTVNTKPFKDAHFATFPQELILDCIKAGCPEGGIVLDPFFGSGTTGIVAKKLNRHYIGIELNPKYIAIAEKRLYKELGMFLNP